MNPVLLIQRKRDGQRLSAAEIDQLVSAYTARQLPDYQMAALAMAIYFRGLDAPETAALTQAMLRSGSTLTGPPGRLRVDKHSTGGIGDKTSLLLAPLLACCDLDVPMLSGRGLGATGGTLDKLEAIPGFRTDLNAGEIQQALEQVGCVITGQTADLVPADKHLYALRDVTATVPSLALITASILSKKLAEGLHALVLDVKWGSGAFMKTLPEARALAQSLVEVATAAGLKAAALVTDMNQPLGRAVGNAIEVNEVLESLRGSGPADLLELTLALGAELLVLCGRATSPEAALTRLRAELTSGRAHERFQRQVVQQGGQPVEPLPLEKPVEVCARQDGFVAEIHGEKLGYAVIALGGGRQHLHDAIDPSVGLMMHVRLGDAVVMGQPLATLFVGSRGRDEALQLAQEAVIVGFEKPLPKPLIVERVAAATVEQVDISSRQAIVGSTAGNSPADGSDLLSEDSWAALVCRARAVRDHAYAPYSHFLVGAALEADDGRVFVGCNVENGSYSLTQCAERVALTAAVAAGSRRFRKLALVAAAGCTPCGACRQVLAEFCPELPVLLVAADDSQPPRLLHLSELLPHRFAME